MIHEPELLFLDEPTAGIDPVARRQLWDLLFELSANGVTLLVTTHYMDEAERCTDIGYIHMSKLLVGGKPGQLKQLPQVTPAGTRRYELRVRNPASHLVQLRNSEHVLDATLFGETLHLLVSDACPPEALVASVQASGAVATIQEIPPSLEDVFVTLTRDAERLPTSPAHSPEAVVGGAEIVTSGPEPGLDLVVEESSGTEPSKMALKPSRPRRKARKIGHTTDGLVAIMVKEFAHIRRQPSTLFFMLVVPVMQTIIFGYAIDTQIEHIPLVVFDQDGRSDRPAAGRGVCEYGTLHADRSCAR